MSLRERWLHLLSCRPAPHSWRNHPGFKGRLFVFGAIWESSLRLRLRLRTHCSSTVQQSDSTSFSPPLSLIGALFIGAPGARLGCLRQLRATVALQSGAGAPPNGAFICLLPCVELDMEMELLPFMRGAVVFGPVQCSLFCP